MKDQHIDPRSLEAFKLLLKKQKELISGLACVKSGLGLVSWLLKVLRLVKAEAPTKSEVKVVKHFCREVYLLAKGSKLPFTILYLKTCSILLQQYVAKHTERASSRKIGGVAVSVTRTGLPRIIPKLQRVLIRKGDVRAITLWLSLFNLYRYLESTHNFKGYNTITDKGSGWQPTPDFFNAVQSFWAALGKLMPGGKIPKMVPTYPHLFDKVSVSIHSTTGVTGSSLWASVHSVWAWRRLAIWTLTNHKDANSYFGKDWKKVKLLVPALTFLGRRTAPWLWTVLTGQVGWTGNLPAVLFPSVMKDPMEFVKQELSIASRSMLSIPKEAEDFPGVGFTDIPMLFGKLVQLKEAAGKVRVIAIVDSITQWVLKPIHDWLFKILKHIPQDGTFNQDAPLERLWKDFRGQFIGSCDMSAATDRLPVILQAHLLSHILGKEMAIAWMRLLTYRPYRTAGLKNLMYRVGQPMGALSSWAALAITHHFLWQWAALRSKATYPGAWFKSYAVLGDDSSAGYKGVVAEYLKICSEIGVGVNLAKSLLSPNGCLEFAKRFWTPRGNCSPISIGEVFVSGVNFATMVNWPLKRKIRLADLLSIMGYKHKVLGSAESKLLSKLPRKVRNMLIVLSSPWGPMPSNSLVEWLLLEKWHVSGGKWPEGKYPVIEIMLMTNRLIAKVAKIVQANGLPLQYFDMSWRYARQYFGKLDPKFPDRETPELRLTAKVRGKDPKTCNAILGSIYEPRRANAFKDARRLQYDLCVVMATWSREAFTDDAPTIQKIWEEYQQWEGYAAAIPPSVYQQRPEKPFVASSPQQVVRLWNRLRNC